MPAKASSANAASSGSSQKSTLGRSDLERNDVNLWQSVSFLDLGCHLFVDKFTSCTSAYWDLIAMQGRECTLIPSVNAKTHGSDVIIQIMYPDADHMILPGVNGAVWPLCLHPEPSCCKTTALTSAPPH